VLEKLMKREQYCTTISTPLGPIELTFQNNSMLRVESSRSEPFFKEVERCWNQCHAEKRDPHGPLQNTVQVGKCMDLEDRKAFVSRFLYLAADATRKLQSGQEMACASLEHHAELM
jgi:hypothetical protein